jgi:hypothetical protein
VQSFLRGIHIIEYDEAALRDTVRHVVTLAEVEDLPAHGQAVRVRFESPTDSAPSDEPSTVGSSGGTSSSAPSGAPSTAGSPDGPSA